MGTKPVWLLDVDGVLNAVNTLEDLRREREVAASMKPHEKHWDDYQDGTATDDHGAGLKRTFGIIWSPQLIARMNALHDAGKVEIRWLTTWEERAQTEIEPLVGLRHFELAGHRDIPGESALGWWKYDIAKVWAETDRPVIWTDDDLNGFPRAYQLFQQRWQEQGVSSCLVAPKWDFGITPTQMDAIESFIEHEYRP